MSESKNGSDKTATAGTKLTPSGNVVLFAVQLLARFLQAIVLLLENTIEWLGYEPERRWETIMMLRGKVPVQTPSAPSLARKAKMLAEKGQTEAALRLYVKVLELQPEDTIVMDAGAELLAELGDAEGARELLTRSIELEPRSSHGKYVLLGHLEHGTIAIQTFENALEILNLELDRLNEAGSKGNTEVPEKRREVKRKMSSVMAAIAKVYLTDCFMETNSQTLCEHLLDQALLYDADNPEACQALADLRMSQNRRGEALVLCRRTVDVCNNLDEGLAPSYDFRCVTARLLVELSQYELAVDLLEDLAQEDSEDTEVMYLLGLCYMLLGDTKRCKQALQCAKGLLEKSRCADTSLMDQINGLLERQNITEEEKSKFWNPRWWVSDDGKATNKEQLEQDATAMAITTDLPALDTLPDNCKQAAVMGNARLGLPV
mmetsp:Transcript_37181/g.44942  ORF Transcript_37181/g.44942 Transcript_37181/m.44942 type:complete len:433 (-) Transcript_37181:1314-2612(-)|eukprot:CAMPEP_0197857244 /NCGR_PEP_ID=MMETSP1438-20131217/30114_1 /TAXON_ID=1461541 /ORGANISM="Pterosperma sp., Strain CCMP1384" /LENGTH=432 /DNA_ID=CAMNT_0043473005 /DNA_START=313 /DNA_END=1611 /DNA_ORIENTATION=-